MLKQESLDGTKKRSIFDTEWKNETGSDASIEWKARIAPMAVVTLACGLISLAGFIFPFFLVFSFLTLGCGVVAWGLIWRSSGVLAGKALVRLGAFLAIVPLVAVPLSDAIYRHESIRQGRQFASLVFQAAQSADTLSLSLLKLPSGSRPEVSDEVAYWRNEFKKYEDHTALHLSLLSHPALLTLAALGDRATITYLSASKLFRGPSGSDQLPLTYAVTYSNNKGEKETFFLTLFLESYVDQKEKLRVWKWSSMSNAPVRKLPSEGQGLPLE